MDLKEMTEMVGEFIKEREWERFHTARNIAMALSVEAAELLELFLWKEEDPMNDPEFRKRVEEEMADIQVYLMALCWRYGIDMANAVKRKMEINRRKYPVDKVKGRAVKYTELK